MKTSVVIDSCIMAGLSEMDCRFLRDYQDLRCDDITANGCHITVYRKHHISLNGRFYPSLHAGYYLSGDMIPKKLDHKEFIDNLNLMMDDFFKRNGIDGDTFLLYVSW